MEIVNYLAQIWGISIVVASFALLVNDKHLKGLFAKIESEESLFLMGLVTFVVGLATVMAYNAWTSSWQVIITILGWLTILKGLSHLFFPKYCKTWMKKMETSPYLPYAFIVLLIIGLVITYFGFTA